MLKDQMEEEMLGSYLGNSSGVGVYQTTFFYRWITRAARI